MLSAQFNPASWECPSCRRRNSASSELRFMRGTCHHDVCRACLSSRAASATRPGAVDGSVATVSCPLPGCSRGKFHVEAVVPAIKGAVGDVKTEAKSEAPTPETGARRSTKAEAVVAPASETHLKPRFAVGEEVVAAWWGNEDRRGENEWFPGRIASYKTVDDAGKYGPVRLYEVHFDDGDEITDLEEQYVMAKEDYALTDRPMVGVKNVTDQDEGCGDEWARVVGWYVADIGGEERSFPRLSNAMRAYDDFVVNQKGTQPIAKSHLNRPEKYPWLWNAANGTNGAKQDPSEESDGEESRFSDVEEVVEVDSALDQMEPSEQAFMTKPLLHLNPFVRSGLKENACFGLFVEKGIVTPGYWPVPVEMVPQIDDMSQDELRRAMKANTWFASVRPEETSHAARLVALWMKNAVVGSFVIMRHEYPKCEHCPDWLKDGSGDYIGPVYVIGIVTEQIAPWSLREEAISDHMSDSRFDFNLCLVDWKRMGRKDDLQEATQSYIHKICQPTVAVICKNRNKIYDGGVTAESIRRDLLESSRDISEMVDVPWQTIAAAGSDHDDSEEDVHVTGIDEEEILSSRKRKADALQQAPGEAKAEGDPFVHFEVASMPSSIREVIRLMDKLEPGREYYRRQEDCRGECSKMRGKLRKYARENEEELGVAHWIESGEWTPPDNEALSALMLLIRTMIDKSWPLEG